MNQACFLQNTNLHEHNIHASSIRPLKKNFVRMKIKILMLGLMFISTVAFSQSPVDKLFDKYSGKEGFTTVYITQYMFEMFKNVNTNDKEFDDLVKGLKSIRILSVENKKAVPANINFFKEIMKELPLDQYKELMVVKEKDQEVKFLIKENQGRISEFLLVSGGKDNALICIQGNIDMKSLARLSKNLNINGMKPLEKMDKGNSPKK